MARRTRAVGDLGSRSEHAVDHEVSLEALLVTIEAYAALDELTWIGHRKPPAD